MLLQVAYDKVTRVALVQVDAAVVPAGSVNVGSFEHPDTIYPDSVVIYHGVRELLYKRSAVDPAVLAMFPENITDMQYVSIVYGIIPVTGVTFDLQNVTVAKDATVQLTYALTPTNASDTGVTFSSHNPQIATVSSTGLVTGVSKGLVTIKIDTNFGVFYDTVEVTVN